MVVGKLISFEGGEGVGKTTQVSRLCDHLTATAINAVSTREPGGSQIAEEIRNLILGWEMSTEIDLPLFVAAHQAHVEYTVRPKLLKGTWVVSDRYLDSTWVYQGYEPQHRLENKDWHAQRRVSNYLFAAEVSYPDLTILLDMTTTEALARLASRGDDLSRYERQPLTYHMRIREGYEQLAQDTPGRIVLVNANRHPDEVEAEIWQIVRERFNLEEST